MPEFQKGNKMWELVEHTGRPKIFNNESEIWEKALEYFNYVYDNPLLETQIHGKDANECIVPKMRAMTIQGLCFFLDISDDTFANYEKSTEFFGIITRIKRIIWCWKFEGAAAGLLQANIISRELGLMEKTDNTTTIKLGKELEEEYE
jgi:hypothetical protein